MDFSPVSAGVTFHHYSPVSFPPTFSLFFKRPEREVTSLGSRSSFTSGVSSYHPREEEERRKRDLIIGDVAKDGGGGERGVNGGCGGSGSGGGGGHGGSRREESDGGCSRAPGAIPKGYRSGNESSDGGRRTMGQNQVILRNEKFTFP